MKKLLIIGASILQLPAIKKAKENGYYTIVADFNPNAIGIPYADEFRCEHYQCGGYHKAC